MVVTVVLVGRKESIWQRSESGRVFIQSVVVPLICSAFRRLLKVFNDVSSIVGVG